MVNRNHFISSAAGMLEVLEVFAGHRGPIPLGVLVKETGKPKGTVHRMLATLVNTEFVEQEPSTGHYKLTLKLLRLGTAALNGMDILDISRPWLEQLMQAADETVHLAMLDPSGGVIYVSKIESPRSIRVQTKVGSLSPSWCTATGRCLLAFNPYTAKHVLSQSLKALTSVTVTDPAQIRQILEKVAEIGHAVTRGENHPEMGGIATPIRDHSGKVIAACGIAIPAFRMDESLIERCIPLVTHTGLAISKELGHSPEEFRNA